MWERVFVRRKPTILSVGAIEKKGIKLIESHRFLKNLCFDVLFTRYCRIIGAGDVDDVSFFYTCLFISLRCG